MVDVRIMIYATLKGFCDKLPPIEAGGLKWALRACQAASVSIGSKKNGVAAHFDLRLNKKNTAWAILRSHIESALEVQPRMFTLRNVGELFETAPEHC